MFDIDEEDHQSSTRVRWQACTQSQSRESGRRIAATENIAMMMKIVMTIVVIRMIDNLVKEKDGEGGVDSEKGGGGRWRGLLAHLVGEDQV